MCLGPFLLTLGDIFPILNFMFAVIKTPEPILASSDGTGQAGGKLMTQFAVIKTGGKQYIVSPGKKIKVEKLPVQEGGEVEFSEVLLLENEKGLIIGAPLVGGAKVKGKLLQHGKGEKLVIFKFKAKKRERRKKGHRQPYSEVQITSITG